MKWKPIKETFGAYWISEYGDVYRYSYCKIYNNNKAKYKLFDEGYINISSRGRYKRVNLGSKNLNRYIHRLVAQTFLNTKEKECVNHIDGNKHNNHYSNLEWVTFKENSQHASQASLINTHSEKRKKQAPLNAKKGGIKNRKYNHLGKIYEIDYKTSKVVKIHENFYAIGKRCHYITTSRERAVHRLEYGEVKRSGKINTYYLWEEDYNKFKNKLHDN